MKEALSWLSLLPLVVAYPLLQGCVLWCWWCWFCVPMGAPAVAYPIWAATLYVRGLVLARLDTKKREHGGLALAVTATKERYAFAVLTLAILWALSWGVR